MLPVNPKPLTLHKKMMHFLMPIFTILMPFLFVGLANGYTDQDVKLFNAAQRGNLEKIRVLLDQGADINVRLGVDQWTPLMTASREGKLEAVELLLEEGADPNIRKEGRSGVTARLVY
jgi:hypothetical protein